MFDKATNQAATNQPFIRRLMQQAHMAKARHIYILEQLLSCNYLAAIVFFIRTTSVYYIWRFEISQASEPIKHIEVFMRYLTRIERLNTRYEALANKR